MSTIFPVPPATLLPIAGTSDTFPVRRVYCVGRNYDAHTREMGGDTRDPPFFFMKATDCLQPIPEGKATKHPYPPKTDNYHFEIEIVAVLHKGGKDIPVDKALDHVFGYAVGLDMTRRDLQDQAKKMARPWELGKSSDLSGPVGPIYPAAKIGHPTKGDISLLLNGVKKQKGDISDMIWSVAEQVAYLSTYFELAPGDVIFSGTPEGVGAVKRGETMTAIVEGIGQISVEVV